MNNSSRGLEHEKIVISSCGAALSSCAALFIIMKRLFLKTHRAACLHLFITDFLFASTGILLTAMKTDKKLIPFSKAATLVDLLAIIPVVLDRVIAVKTPLLYGTPRHWKVSFISYALCWVIPGSYTAATEAIKMPFSKVLYLDLLLFMVTPTALSIISFSLVIHTLATTKMTNRNVSQLVTSIKSIVITSFFVISWLVPVVELFGNTTKRRPPPKLGFMYYLNSITDPLFYLVPNSFIINRINKIIERTSSLATTSTKRTSDIS